MQQTNANASSASTSLLAIAVRLKARKACATRVSLAINARTDRRIASRAARLSSASMPS